jgi:hypothetical protein
MRKGAVKAGSIAVAFVNVDLLRPPTKEDGLELSNYYIDEILNPLHACLQVSGLGIVSKYPVQLGNFFNPGCFMFFDYTNRTGDLQSFI